MSEPNDPIRDGDYLWDRGGAPDPHIVRLERLLSRYALEPTPLAPGARPAIGRAARSRGRRWRMPLALAAALALLLLGGLGWYRLRLDWPEDRPWQATLISGQAHTDRQATAALTRFAPGDTLRTGPGSSVRLRVARVGDVVVGERSQVELLETRSGHHRLRLTQGSLWARIWAPPGTFGVATPATDVYDLGCEFVLRVDARGDGALTVLSGWIELGDALHRVLVPQHARAELRADGVSGTPYDLDASAAFVTALREIDRRTGDADDATIARLIANARPQDAISLLSLLNRYPKLGEGPLFESTAQLMPAGVHVRRDALLARDPAALDPWWHALPYPRLKHWWLQWPDAFGATVDPDRPGTASRTGG